MALAKPGEYITTRCGRCNDITGHVVMLVLDGEISKVECKACGSIHKYRETTIRLRPKLQSGQSVRKVRAGESRDQATELYPARSTRSTTPKSAGGKSGTGRKLSGAKLELAWQEAMLRHSADTPLAYSMQEAYQPLSLIEHPVFGKGEILKVLPPDKMEVLFQEGVKVLRCKV